MTGMNAAFLAATPFALCAFLVALTFRPSGSDTTDAAAVPVRN
jgi:hypothetical protein